MQEWDAQIVVGPELARALIREQFPALGGALEPFGSGWDNTAYLVDGELVFRFPRRQIAVPLLEREVRVLPLLAPRLPIPIPNPQWAGAPTDAFPWPYAGYRLLAGHTADRSIGATRSGVGSRRRSPHSCARCMTSRRTAWTFRGMNFAELTSVRDFRCCGNVLPRLKMRD